MAGRKRKNNSTLARPNKKSRKSEDLYSIHMNPDLMKRFYDNKLALLLGDEAKDYGLVVNTCQKPLTSSHSGAALEDGRYAGV